MAFVEVDPFEFESRIIGLFGRRWALAMAGSSPEDCNAMTIEWGGVGMIWGKPAATVYIRESRYTKVFIDANDTFAVAFLPEELHDKHKVFGTMSGRDVNKTELTGLTPIMVENTPIYEESDIVLICRKAYANVLDAEHYIDQEARRRYYGHPATEGDEHTMYIGYIEKILRKE